MFSKDAQPRQRQSKPCPVPDLDKLPADALLTRRQLVALTGFADITFKQWATKNGRGPKITYVEGLPRHRAEDVRTWIRGEQRG